MLLVGTSIIEITYITSDLFICLQTSMRPKKYVYTTELILESIRP